VSDTEAPAPAPEFPVCEQCPTREACGVAEFCVIESRFGRADLSIGELTCRSCDRGSESAWSCTKGGDCDASSTLWGLWFLVRLYANKARNARTAQPSTIAAEGDLGDDWESCDHDHDEDCYDYQGFYQCHHEHCFNCGECGCAGYCDDYQTYNLRPAETGGTDD
jgi:hypothetical protein